MATMSDCIQILRRRIGDTEEPYTYTDELLVGYLEDSVAQINMEYPRPDIIIELHEFINGVSDVDAQLFAIKAHYIITLRTKEKSDRDNFRMVKGRLTLDNTNQSKDHKDTLDLLEKEYKRTLLLVKNGGGTMKGIRVE